MQDDDRERGWSGELRAENRRYGGGPSSRWLRKDSGGRGSYKDGDTNHSREGHTQQEESNDEINCNKAP